LLMLLAWLLLRACAVSSALLLPLLCGTAVALADAVQATPFEMSGPQQVEPRMPSQFRRKDHFFTLHPPLVDVMQGKPGCCPAGVAMPDVAMGSDMMGSFGRYHRRHFLVSI
jgi:hypothetical protein